MLKVKSAKGRISCQASRFLVPPEIIYPSGRFGFGFHGLPYRYFRISPTVQSPLIASGMEAGKARTLVAGPSRFILREKGPQCMRYQRIRTRIWYDEVFINLSEDARTLYLYLMTSPHSNALGLYIIPKKYIECDLRWDHKRLATPFDELMAKGRIMYDEAVNLLCIPNHLKHNPLENENQAKAAAKIVTLLPKSSLFSAILERLTKRFHEPLRKALLERSLQTGGGNDGEVSGKKSGGNRKSQMISETLKPLGEPFREPFGKPETEAEAETEYRISLGEQNSAPPPIDPEIVPNGQRPKNNSLPFKQIISYLNDVTGRNFDWKTKSYQGLIRARWREGKREDEFKYVIDIKASKWLGDAKMQDFLRPETLFGTKMTTYLSEKPQMGAGDLWVKGKEVQDERRRQKKICFTNDKGKSKPPVPNKHDDG